LHAHFECFPWAEHDIGDDLSTSGGDEEADGLVLVRLFTERTLVDILENFVETKLGEALQTVANERREPAL